MQISLTLLRFVFKLLNFLRVVLSRFYSKTRLSSTAKMWLTWISIEGLSIWGVSIPFDEIWFPLSLMWDLWIVLLRAPWFFLASWIFTLCLFTNQTQGIPVHSFGAIYLNSFSLSSAMLQKIHSFIFFSEWQPASSTQKEQCSAWIPFLAESTFQQKAKVTVCSSYLIFFSESRVAQCLTTVALYILFIL